MKLLTNSALALTMLVGSAGLTIGCDDDRTVESKTRTETNSDGSMEKKTTETKVDTDTGAVKKETTTVEKDTTP